MVPVLRPAELPGRCPAPCSAYGTDLRAFAAFSQLSLVRHGASHSSYGAPPEENTFFGAPLLIAAGLIVAWLWRRVAVRALTAVALVFFVLSLGRTVMFGGRTVLRRGPMSVLGHLPLFDSAVPTRFGLALIPVVAILLAFSVQRRGGRIRGLAAVRLGAGARRGPAADRAHPPAGRTRRTGPRVLHQRAMAPVRAR